MRVDRQWKMPERMLHAHTKNRPVEGRRGGRRKDSLAISLSRVRVRTYMRARLSRQIGREGHGRVLGARKLQVVGCMCVYARARNVMDEKCPMQKEGELCVPPKSRDLWFMGSRDALDLSDVLLPRAARSISGFAKFFADSTRRWLYGGGGRLSRSVFELRDWCAAIALSRIGISLCVYCIFSGLRNRFKLYILSCI